MNDAEIIELYWSRSETAIHETSKKYGGYCSTIAMNILHNREDCEECVSDTFFKVWSSIPPQRPTLLKAFLGRITRNLSLNKYKAYTAEKRGGGTVELLLSELEDCIPSMRNVEAEYEAGVVAGLISKFLSEISKEQRLIFIRRYWYADKIEAISKRYDISENNIKSILRRTRIKLKEFLEKEGVTL
ncbi:MAG: sigma-70 family RNA polymerase sigma factor [Oscillospiraceae bacterium]|nr:sigma-70 family RNA polymerase sigma factor [Oscillospiraceae bacterium]